MKTIRILAAALALLAPALHAAIFTVTNTNDSGAGSLRQTLADAAALAGVDTVFFEAGLNGGTIALTGALNAGDADGVIVSATHLPAGLAIQAAAGERVFANFGTLTLRGLTLRGANIGAAFGGGAIYNAGAATLTLDECTLSGNNAGLGGGLFNDGTATLLGCTISGNSANSGSALYNRNLTGPGSMALQNCTVTGNTAGTDHSIINDGALSLTHCTVAGNLSQGNYGGMRNEAGRTFTVTNSIIGGRNSAANTGLTDLLNAGTATFFGANLCEKFPVNTGGGTVGGPGTLPTADPLLDALADNGGRTKTLLPLAGSPAIDATPNPVVFYDQRNSSRPLDGDGNGSVAYDIGAVEIGCPDLVSITLSKGTLTPAFARATTYYTTGVSFETTSITLTPAAAVPGATIRVFGNVVASGTASGAIPLVVGPNQIPVVVTAPDGYTTKTYTVIVARVDLQTLIVTSAADSGHGSLRQVMLNAAPYAASYFIAFDAGLSGQTIMLSSGPLVVGGSAVLSFTLDASDLAGGLTINGTNNGASGIFDNNGELTLRALTLRNGHAPNGGAIRNNGILTLERCSLFQNFSFTSGGLGGAVHTFANRTATFRQCTFVDNYGSNGGAISNAGTTALIHCTVAGNAQNNFGAVLNDVGGKLTLENSIVAGNTRTGSGAADDIANLSTATLTRIGANIVQTPITNSGTVTGAGTISNVNPLLAPWANYGGLTNTMRPQGGSPAIDAAVGSTETIDQRGFARPVDGDSAGAAIADIGSVEMGNADLTGLVLGAGALSPAFAKTTTSYTSGVPFETSSTNVTPTAADAGSTITVNGTPVASGSASGSIALGVGANVITTVVTAPDGRTKTYTVTVTRADNPNLSNLVLSAGTLSPAFASTTTGYSALVSAATNSTTVTPTAALGGSMITVNGTPVASGAASGGIALNFGANTITIFVTAPNGITTKTYTVTVFRPRLVSNNADSGAGSLRQAIADANANPGVDVITFAPALGGQTITLTTGALLVTDAAGVTIDASPLAGGLTVNGNGADRVFFVNGGGLTLQSLTLTGGFTAAGNGGGAVLNNGGVVLDRCTLTGNSAGYGAALFNQAGSNSTLRHCTLAANVAVNSGGAIDNRSTAVATLTHCTVAGNSATTNNFSEERCGGLHNRNALLTLENCIVAGNTATTANDVLNDHTSALFLNGANIIQAGIENYGNVGGSGTVVAVNPLLAPPGNYGGPTPTMALLPGSPARDASTGSTITSDQRGFPIVGTPDIGAYEAGTFTNYNAWIYETLPATTTLAWHASTFDFDNDGQTNGDEFNYLTNPASSSSTFLPATTRSGANLLITFASATGRTYTLQQSDTLAPASWTSAPNAALTGDGTVKTFTVPAAVARRFFRVQAAP